MAMICSPELIVLLPPLWHVFRQMKFIEAIFVGHQVTFCRSPSHHFSQLFWILMGGFRRCFKLSINHNKLAYLAAILFDLSNLFKLLSPCDFLPNCFQLILINGFRGESFLYRYIRETGHAPLLPCLSMDHTHLIIFISWTTTDFCGLPVTFANSLDPDQNVGPDLDPNF